MVKRKFSFNLAPVKIASRADLVDKPTSEPTPSQPSSSSSHRRHTSKDSICDYSPYIDRRVLDSQTEQELRSACRHILQNFKPSDHGMEDTDPKLDFGGPNRRKETKPQVEVNVRMPTGAPTDMSSSSFMVRKPSTKTRTRAKADLEIKARSHGDMPARANSSRKRADFGWLDERDDRRDEKLRTHGKTSIDVPRSTVFRNDSDEHVATPVAVPSRYAHAKTSSSAPLSASLPAGRTTNRRSHNFDDPAAIADAQAVAWMRQELEKKRQAEASNPQVQPSTAARPPSRAASIKGSVKEYFIPGSRSRALSRAQSKESLRSTATNDDQNLSRNGSNSGWRSWGIRARSSSRNNSRPGTSKGQTEEAQPRKSESNGLNLNRELPPLPSLDTWKDTWEEQDIPAEVKVASPKSPTAGTHIASLMRPQEQHQERSPAARKSLGKSGSDAMQYGDAFPVRQSSRKQGIQPIPQPTRTAPGSPGNAEHTMTGWSSTSNLDHRLELSSGNHTRQRSGDSRSASNSNRSADPSSFSHKMSVDSPVRGTFPTEPKTPGKEEQKSKLKKIFSGWMTKGHKKEDWMHKIEKEGVKEGVLVQDSATASPVVRY